MEYFYQFFLRQINLMSENENLKSAEVPSPRLQILKSEFECLPAYMKGLASWEVRYFMRCF